MNGIEHAPVAPLPGPPASSGEPAGVTAAEGALVALAGLADRPVAEQLTVLDRAHTTLRQVLDAPAS